MPRPRNFIGLTFGKLKVIADLPFGRSISGKAYRRVKCLCACGNEATARTEDLVRGQRTSCGCLRDENVKLATIANIKHGHTSRLGGTATYRSWQAMLRRCETIGNIAYKRYGGRGITVCERWHSFANFLADMGERPPNSTIDRKDTNGNYEPDNCKWSTPAEQARNRSDNRVFTIRGVTGCVTDLAVHFGILRVTVWSRLRVGLSPEEAFTRPVKHPRSAMLHAPG